MPAQIFTISDKHYHCRSIRRVQLDETGSAVDAGSPRDRYLRQVLVLSGNIVDAFAHDIEFDWAAVEGYLDHLADSGAETRFGFIEPPPLVNAASHDGGANDALFGAELNPKAAVVWQGAPWILSKDATATGNLAKVEIFKFPNRASNWDLQATVLDTATADLPRDLIVHKNKLFALVSNGTDLDLLSSTDGTTWSAGTPAHTGMTTGQAAAGSRLLSDGETIWLTAQKSTTDFRLQSSADNGDTFATLADVSGICRDLDVFYDPEGFERPVVLTEDALYRVDSDSVRKMFDLPKRGIALARYGQLLLVFMTDMRVLAIAAGGAVTDISPGGPQGMADATKQFGVAATDEVAVAVWPAIDGVYVLWTRSDQKKPLVLFWSGLGWHFIAQAAAASLDDSTWAGRFICINPAEDNLLWGYIKSAAAAETTLHEVPEISTPVPNATDAKDYSQATAQVRFPQVSFGDPSVTYTCWDALAVGTGLATGKTVTPRYKADGGSLTSLTALTSAYTKVSFPTTTSSVGKSLTVLQMYLDLITNGANAGPRVSEVAVAYSRMPTARWAYVLEIDLAKTAAAEASPGDVTQIAKTLRDDVVGSKVKLTCSYAYESSLSLVPVSRTDILEQLRGNLDADTSDGIWTVVLADV